MLVPEPSGNLMRMMLKEQDAENLHAVSKEEHADIHQFKDISTKNRGMKKKKKKKKEIVPEEERTTVLVTRSESTVENGVSRTKEKILLPESVIAGSTPVKAKLTPMPKEIANMKDQLGNIIKVPEELLDTFMQVYKDSSTEISKDFLSKIAPVYLAFDDAMSFSTVAMRDGLSFDTEIDLEIVPLLEWVTRLAALEKFLTMMPISKELKDKFMSLSTFKAVEKCFQKKFGGFEKDAVSTDNKVAGIVTSIGTGKQTQIPDSREKMYNMLDGLQRMADASKRGQTVNVSKRAKQSTTDARPPIGAAMMKKKR